MSRECSCSNPICLYCLQTLHFSPVRGLSIRGAFPCEGFPTGNILSSSAMQMRVRVHLQKFVCVSVEIPRHISYWLCLQNQKHARLV